MRLRACVVLCVVAVLGCGPTMTSFDSGGFVVNEDDDAGASPDAGIDGGGVIDAGEVDAGAPVDAGPLDAGSFDAGAPDGGPRDAGVIDAGSPDVSIAAIKTLAAGSSCYRYQWVGRGQMPVGFIKGVALSFARSVCQPSRTDLAIVSRAATTDAVHDALAHYSAIFSGLNLNNSVAGTDTLRHVYTLLIGLGMRESSGEHCVGRDTSASNYTSDSSEAGAWQTSWDSHTLSTELVKLFNQYKASTRGCFSTEYAQGVTCNAANWMNWGTGVDGLRFQQMEKECPGFAAEYAAVMLRISGGSSGHYGPLRTRAAEVKTECDTMLRGVQDIVVAHPEVCSAL